MTPPNHVLQATAGFALGYQCGHRWPAAPEHCPITEHRESTITDKHTKVMKNFNQLLVATRLSAALLLPGRAQAMEIWQYDKMADKDQAEYVADLVQGAEKVLKDAGKADQAAQVSKLFTTHLGKDQTSVGMTEFYRNLILARATDQKNVKKDPNAPRLEVEDALGVTLKKNGIELPDSFFTVMQDFKPKHPPQSSDDGKKKKN